MTRTPDDLEKHVDRVVRDLPDRRAPATLEARVLAEIARRAELPWWRQSYSHWPAVMRAGFHLLSAATAAATVAGLFRLARGPESAQWTEFIRQHLGWLASLRDLGRDIWETGADLYRAVPPLWLRDTLAALTVCYAVLIGVAAAVYRTLFKRL